MTLLDVPVRDVFPDPRNPRHSLGDIEALSASIRGVGLLEPVVVRPHPDKPAKWMLIAGARRHAAHLHLKEKTIRATVSDIPADEALAVMLVENLQREDISPVDEATAYQTLLGLGWTQTRIVSTTGRSKAVVSKRLRILDLPTHILVAVRTGQVTVETAYETATVLRNGDQNVKDAVLEAAMRPAEALESALTRTVEWAQHRIRFTTLEQKLRAEQAASGATELDGSPGAVRVEGYGSNVLEVDYDEHRKEPCSRFQIVGNLAPRVEWWCADGRRHLPAGDSALKGEGAWVDRQLGRPGTPHRLEADRNARRAGRVEFYQATVDGDLPVSDELVYQQAALLLIETMNSEEMRLACTLLHLPVKKSETHAGLRRVLSEKMATHPVRAVLAVALAAGEGWRIEQAEPSLERQFVRLLGYEGLPEDQQVLA